MSHPILVAAVLALVALLTACAATKVIDQDVADAQIVTSTAATAIEDAKPVIAAVAKDVTRAKTKIAKVRAKAKAVTAEVVSIAHPTTPDRQFVGLIAAAVLLVVGVGVAKLSRGRS